MTTEQLRYFVSIVENGSFSETAATLNVSQSSVTKQIQAFENELAVSLFDRTHRTVGLTEIGATAYHQAKTILDLIDDLVSHTNNYAKSKKSIIKIATLPILGIYGFTELIQQFELDHPDITIEFEETEESQILKLLSTGNCDIAILREEFFPYDTYKIHRLTKDHLCLFVNDAHPLSKKECITPYMLQNLPLMLMPKYTDIYKLCINLFKSNQMTPCIMQCARIETIISSVETGRCSALLMSQVSRIFHSKHVKQIPLDPPVVSNVIAVTNPTSKQQPLMQQLIAFLQQ